MDYSEQMRVAYESVKRGDKAFARQVVEEVLSSDPDIEAAWDLYAHIATNREDAIHSLKQVLELNPFNERAKEQINRLQQQPMMPQPVANGVKPSRVPENAYQSSIPGSLRLSESTRTQILLGMGGLAFFLIICGAFYVFAA